MIRYLIAAAVLAVPSDAPPEDNLSRWKANMARHQQVVMHGVPEPYAGLRDPTPEPVPEDTPVATIPGANRLVPSSLHVSGEPRRGG